MTIKSVAAIELKMKKQILKEELIISELFPMEYHIQIWKIAKKKKMTPLEFIITTIINSL